MSDDKIIRAWNRMNPDNYTKEKILRKIQNSVEATDGHCFKKSVFRFAAAFSVVIVVVLGSFSSVYAISPAFRNYVHSLLFPVYTSDEMISIENGHMTGSFDEIDVLLTFLDKFNRLEFGNSITAYRENGYHYSLFAQDDNHLQAFVDSSVEGYRIVVYMERLEYENTEGIWQVTGYRVVEDADGEITKE